MRGQQSGMSQSQPRQESDLSDMQLWQQKLMFQQLKEFQRQKQFQQLDQETRQQSPMNRMSDIAKQAASEQLPALVNGTPIHDVPNNLWSNELMRGDSKVPSSSNMYMVGNMNWAQRGGSSAVQAFPNGLLFSHEQGQALRSMGLVPQQGDQSLYGAPIASTRDVFNQYSHVQGISQDCANYLTRTSGNQLQKPTVQLSSFNSSFQGDQSSLFPDLFSMQDVALVSRQGFQGKNFSDHVPFQGTNTEAQSGNFQKVNSLLRNSPVQEFHGRQQQAVWSGNLQEKAASQVGSSLGLVRLDPMEEKILFSSDGWDAPIGKSGIICSGGYGSPLESVQYLNAFPSIHNGTWSALMQSAVAEVSSSETGLQDEWSGLSFQNTELSTGNQPATLSDSGKWQTDWADNNLQSASSLTSRSFPLLDDAKMSQNTPGFQQSGTNISFEQSKGAQPASYETIPHSSKKTSKWLDHRPQQKSLVEESNQLQPSVHLENVSQGAWAGQVYEQSESGAHSTDVELNAQNMQGSWVDRHSMSVSPSRDAALKICESGNSSQHSHSNDLKMGMCMEGDHDGGIWKADDNHLANSFPNFTDGLEQAKSGVGRYNVNREASHLNSYKALPNSSTTNADQETNKLVPNSHHFYHGKHMVDSSVNNYGGKSGGKYQHQLSPQVLQSSMNNSDRGLGETCDKTLESCYQKEISNDSYCSNESYPTVTGGGLGKNSLLSASESHSSATGNQKLTGQVGQNASGLRRFQYHPMGNLVVDSEPGDATKCVAHSQALSEQVTRGLRSHKQEYFGLSKFVEHVPNNAIDMEKGPFPDFQGNTKGLASFNGLSGFFNQSPRTVQTCQNMLELFHKVDQSREHDTVTQFCSSNHNPSSKTPVSEASNASFAHQQQDQSAASQGFSLRPTSPQQLPASQNSSQGVIDLNSRDIDSKVGQKSQTWLAPASSMQSLHPHELSQREHWDNKSSTSGKTSNETSQSIVEANISSAFTTASSYSSSQLQPQHTSILSGQVMENHSVNISYDVLASHFRRSHEIHRGVVADQSAQASFPGTSSRMPPFNLAPLGDPSQPIHTDFARVLGQRSPVLESVPVSKPSVMSGKSQQGTFSTMLHNVWTNASTKQHQICGPSQMVLPKFSEFIDPSSSNLERSSLAAQKPGDQDVNKVRNGSEFGTCSVNSQSLNYGEEPPEKESSWQPIQAEKVDLCPQTSSGASQGQESVAKNLPDKNSIAYGLLVAHPHQQELDRGRYGEEPFLVSQTGHVSLHKPATSNRDIEAFGQSLKQSHLLHKQYSSLDQVQSAKSAETDPDKRGAKRFRGADSAPEVQQEVSKVGHKLFDGYNTIFRDVNNELNAAAWHNSFSFRDGKMFSFSSEGTEFQNTNASSQLVVRDVAAQDILKFGQNESQRHSVKSLISENPQVNPQMAPTWFEQFGTLKNGQMLPMYDARRTVKTAAQQFFFGKASESLHPHFSSGQVNVLDASQVGSACQSTITTLVSNECLSPPLSLPSDITDQSLVVVRPKKRKSESLELLPWHKEVTNGSQRLQNISMADQSWAHAANRLVEKVEDEVEMVEDEQPTFQPQKRLILTTQLMQQLLRPAPSAILSAEITSDYESVTYFVAKFTLGEACGLMSCSRSDLDLSTDNGNMESVKLKTCERVGNQYFSEVVEDFVGKARKLETDLLRFEKRTSILDIRVECQDLERFSVINRFAKFHGRSQADRAETSLPSDAVGTIQKTCPQRYVTAFAMPRNLPHGVQCLSL